MTARRSPHTRRSRSRTRACTRIVERQALVDGLTGHREPPRGARRRSRRDRPLRAPRRRRSRSSSPTSTTSRRSTTRTATRSGDDVLRSFATVLRETVRDSDLAGRWGGEEFLLLLPGADEEGAAQLAERVRVALAERCFPGVTGPSRVTCSFGVAQHRPGDEHRSALRRRRPGPLPGQGRPARIGSSEAPDPRSFRHSRPGRPRQSGLHARRATSTSPTGGTPYAGRDTVRFRAGDQGSPGTEGAELRDSRPMPIERYKADGIRSRTIRCSRPRSRRDSRRRWTGRAGLRRRERRGASPLARRGDRRRGHGRDERGARGRDRGVRLLGRRPRARLRLGRLGSSRRASLFAREERNSATRDAVSRTLRAEGTLGLVRFERSFVAGAQACGRPLALRGV